MSSISSDKNYTGPKNSGIDSSVDRVGDLTGEPPVNAPIDRDKASKMANLLEGLQFPATKEEIKDHINRKSPSMGNRVNDVFEAVYNRLEDGIRYDNVYAVEQAAGLVEKKVNE
jgi:hypothetical protein